MPKGLICSLWQIGAHENDGPNLPGTPWNGGQLSPFWSKTCPRDSFTISKWILWRQNKLDFTEPVNRGGNMHLHSPIFNNETNSYFVFYPSHRFIFISQLSPQYIPLSRVSNFRKSACWNMLTLKCLPNMRLWFDYRKFNKAFIKFFSKQGELIHKILHVLTLASWKLDYDPLWITLYESLIKQKMWNFWTWKFRSSVRSSFRNNTPERKTLFRFSPSLRPQCQDSHSKLVQHHQLTQCIKLTLK